MPFHITKLATLPMKSDATIENPESEAGKAWQSIIQTILAQEGAQRMHWGRQVEQPNRVQTIVDWDAVDSYNRFAASAAYGALFDALGSLLAESATIQQVRFDSETPAAVLGRTPSGVMEHLIVYFAPGLTDADRSSWETVWSRFVEGVMAEHALGFRGVAAGWLADEVRYEGHGATGFVALLGWDSVEMHWHFRKTKEFQENIASVRDACKGMAMHHVIFHEGSRVKGGSL